MPRGAMRGIGALVTVGVLVLAGLAAWGDEIRVPEDYDSLEEAMKMAGWDDVILISHMHDVHESISVRNVRRVTITGSWVFSNNTIEGRYDTEPVIELINCSDITFENVDIIARRLSDNRRTSSGGIRTERCSDIQFINCSITTHGGPGIEGGGIELENCTIRDNLTWGIELVGDPSDPTATELSLEDTTVTSNPSGGLRIQDAVVTLEESSFTSNSGYGIMVDGNSEVRFRETGSPSRITGNALGGILVSDATFTPVSYTHLTLPTN